MAPRYKRQEEDKAADQVDGSDTHCSVSDRDKTVLRAVVANWTEIQSWCQGRSGNPQGRLPHVGQPAWECAQPGQRPF
jgi:hypothetical protein